MPCICIRDIELLSAGLLVELSAPEQGTPYASDDYKGGAVAVPISIRTTCTICDLCLFCVHWSDPLLLKCFGQ